MNYKLTMCTNTSVDMYIVHLFQFGFQGCSSVSHILLLLFNVLVYRELWRQQCSLWYLHI